MRPLASLLAAAAIAAFGFGGVQTAFAEPSDLVSVWQFDEDADEFGIARDAVDGNDGTVNGAVSTESGAFGRALDFDGVVDFVEVNRDATLEPANFTIEAKIKILDNSGFNRIAVKTHTGQGRQSYALAVEPGGKVELRMQENGPGTDVVVSTSTVDDGAFHHVAGTFDGSDLRIYVDGVLENTVAKTKAIPFYDTGNFFIGSFNGTIQFFDGVIDELRFWDSALSDGEVAASAELEDIVVAQITAGDNRIKPGVEEISVNGTPLLVFFTASIYDVAGGDVVVCISPDLTVAGVDIEISPTNAFNTRGRTFTPKATGSSFDETDSDDSTSDFSPVGECATIELIVFGTKTKTLHLNLNLVDADTDAPGTGGTGTIVDSVGINVQKNPLGG